MLWLFGNLLLDAEKRVSGPRRIAYLVQLSLGSHTGDMGIAPNDEYLSEVSSSFISTKAVDCVCASVSCAKNLYRVPRIWKI
jgi:hypothetical protein